MYVLNVTFSNSVLSNLKRDTQELSFSLSLSLSLSLSFSISLLLSLFISLSLSFSLSLPLLLARPLPLLFSFTQNFDVKQKSKANHHIRLVTSTLRFPTFLSILIDKGEKLTCYKEQQLGSNLSLLDLC